MRSLLCAALLGTGLSAAAPAVAQVAPPGPVYYNVAPGTPNAPALPAPNVVYDPGGPTGYNQPYIPAPQAVVPPPYSNPAPQPGGRWGGSVNGRWWGGMQAPGGWGAYRRPSRGRVIPGYWMASNFRIPDYAGFGLRAPGAGFFWVRYYDDAVLVDTGGRIWDSVSGIAWAGAAARASAGYDDGYGYGSTSAASSAYASAGAPIRAIDPNQGYYTYPTGGYAPPAAGAPPAVQLQPPCPNACPGYSGGYAGYGGYGYYGGTTTTIVIQPAPMITTTTTWIEEEVVEEEVTTTTTSYVSVPRTKSVPRSWQPKRLKRVKRVPRRNCNC